MGNGRNAFAKQNPSAAFWCEAYKIMTVNARLPLAPKVVLLDEDFFVMEAAGKTLQGVAKEAEYAAVRHDAFEKAGQGLAQLHAAGLHHGRPALRDIAYDKETGTITFLDWENEKKFVDAPAPVLDLFSSCTAASARNGRTMPSSTQPSPAMAASKAAARPWPP